MMKTEYTECGGFLQRDGVEHKEYAEAYSTECQKVEERDGADLLEKVLDRDNLNKAYKRVKANKGASGIDGMTIDEALPWLKEHRDELLESMPDWQAYRNGNTRKGYWAVAGSGILQHTITNERLARRGYYDISEAYKSLHYL